MSNGKLKLIRTSTVPESLNLLLKNQLRFLNKYFNIITVSSSGKQLQEIKEREGVEVYALEMQREIAPIKDFLSLLKWIQFLKKERPAIVHSHSPKANLISVMAAMFCKVPVRIITITGLRFETLTGINKKIVIQLEKLACRCATHIIAEGNDVKNKMIEHHLTSKEIYIIGNGNINGIDTDYWSINNVNEHVLKEIIKKYQLEKTYNFIYVGRLVIDKGINELIKAYEIISRKFSATRLIIVGYYEDGMNQLSPEIINKISTHPQIIFAGFQSDIRPWLMTSRVLILPSYREGFPNVVLQAGAMRIPVIVTKVNGAAEIIDGSNGVVIDIKNTPALLEEMSNFASGKYDENKMGVHGEQIVKEKFNQTFLFGELIKFYMKIIPSNLWANSIKPTL